ncbi:hypothetical protein F5Y17DRAFT_171789 [Xylariaceae sp. FL0594]|nr:hypothetical protein F5Y17DRAFT_171789 [Xylariaceae sp. FL0594]
MSDKEDMYIYEAMSDDESMYIDEDMSDDEIMSINEDMSDDKDRSIDEGMSAVDENFLEASRAVAQITYEDHGYRLSEAEFEDMLSGRWRSAEEFLDYVHEAGARTGTCACDPSCVWTYGDAAVVIHWGRLGGRAAGGTGVEGELDHRDEDSDEPLPLYVSVADEGLPPSYRSRASSPSPSHDGSIFRDGSISHDGSTSYDGSSFHEDSTSDDGSTSRDDSTSHDGSEARSSDSTRIARPHRPRKKSVTLRFTSRIRKIVNNRHRKPHVV